MTQAEVTGAASGTTATVPAARSRTAAAIDVCKSLATRSWCRRPTTRSSVVGRLVRQHLVDQPARQVEVDLDVRIGLGEAGGGLGQQQLQVRRRIGRSASLRPRSPRSSA